MGTERSAEDLGNELADQYFADSQRLAADDGLDGTAVLTALVRRLRSLASEVGVPLD